MYIEFEVDRTLDKSSQRYIIGMISLSIYHWAEKYHLTAQQKHVKNRLKLSLCRDDLYSFFLMTFDYLHYSQARMTVVQDPNNR
jgi:hypothetical protein